MSIISSDSDAEHHSYSERTLAIIKPEAYENAEDIENHIKDNGFIILAVSITWFNSIIKKYEKCSHEIYKLLTNI